MENGTLVNDDPYLTRNTVLLRQARSLKVSIANKRLAAAWNKDYLSRLIGLKPQPI